MRPTIPPADIDVETSILKIEKKLDELDAAGKEIHDYLAQTRDLIADQLDYIKQLGGLRDDS